MIRKSKLERLILPCEDGLFATYVYEMTVSTMTCDGTDSVEVYGIKAADGKEEDIPCIPKISTDKRTVQSIIDVLNNYNIPYVHFIDVVSDLMDEQ